MTFKDLSIRRNVTRTSTANSGLLSGFLHQRCERYKTVKRAGARVRRPFSLGLTQLSTAELAEARGNCVSLVRILLGLT